MSSRARLLLVVFAVLAGLAVLGRQLVVSTANDGMRAGDVVVIERLPLRDSEVGIDDATTEPPVRSALAPQHTQVAALAPNPAELFPNVISGTVVVSGGPPGAAAGARVRCTPSLGTVVDCTVDARDHFEARGIPAGRVVVACKLEGNWAPDTSVVVEDAVPTESVAITLRPLRKLRIWVDDAQGRPIPCSYEYLPLLERLYVQLMSGRDWIGGETNRSLLSRNLISTRLSPTLVALQSSEDERPATSPNPEPWSTLEFVDFPGAHLSLTLEDRVVDSAPIPAQLSDMHLRFDPLNVAAAFTQLDIDVVEEGTNMPVAGLDVFVAEDAMTPIPLRLKTDSSGRARVPYLPPWLYRVGVQGGDYVPAGAVVDIQRGSASCTAHVVVKRGACIEGRVELAANGETQSSAFGHVYLRSIPEGERSDEVAGFVVMPSVPTSDRFEFKGLAPGTYVVELYLGSDWKKNPRVEVDTRAGSVRGLVLRRP